MVLRSADRTLKVILADPSGIDRMLTKGGTNFYGLGYSLIDVALLIANLRTFVTAAGRIVDPEYSRIKESVAAIAPVIASIANSDIYSKSVTESRQRASSATNSFHSWGRRTSTSRTSPSMVGTWRGVTPNRSLPC